LTTKGRLKRRTFIRKVHEWGTSLWTSRACLPVRAFTPFIPILPCFIPGSSAG